MSSYQSAPQILLEHGPGGRAVAFDQASARVIAYRPDEVMPALAELDAARRRGKWVAGYMSYEAGYALEPKLAHLMPEDRAHPLLAFGIFDAPRDPAPVSGAARLSGLRPMISRSDYGAAFARVAEYIRAGDCYQINLTFPMEARLKGTVAGLWASLCGVQRVGYGALVDLGEGPVILSRSPELFFSVSAAGRIEARPMKGTAPRAADPAEDAALADELWRSPKGRAENLMIVDLLRNDLSRISQVGSVRVPELFVVESYATLHQMSSRIVARLLAPPAMTELMPALFPCGSVTGAPKIRAMEIIRELEPFARGAYCGAIGWMGPDGAACFNVAIRTLSILGDRVTLNVGGGLVYDSEAESEWQEAHWKARFASVLADD